MKGTVAPPSASSSTARALERRISGCRAANHGSKGREVGVVKTGNSRGPSGKRSLMLPPRGGGGKGSNARGVSGETPPEVPGGDGPPGAPGLGLLPHPVRLGESALSVGELHR